MTESQHSHCAVFFQSVVHQADSYPGTESWKCSCDEIDDQLRKIVIIAACPPVVFLEALRKEELFLTAESRGCLPL